MEFTKLSEVTVAESISESANVLVEDGGEVKRVAKTMVGGGGGATSLDDLLTEEVVLLEEQTVTLTAEGADLNTSGKPTIGTELTVVYDGTTYKSEVVDLNGFSAAGNMSLIEAGDDTGEPFVVIFQSDTIAGIVGADSTATPTVKIIGKVCNEIPSNHIKVERLYTNASDSYLYADAECTTKATHADFKKVWKIGLLRVLLAAVPVPGAEYVVMEYTPVRIMEDDVTAGSEELYGVITIASDIGSDGSATFKNLYTAEYPGETT